MSVRRRPAARTPHAALDVASLTLGDADDLVRFFAAVSADDEVRQFFHPHPLTADYARELCARVAGCRDRYYLARFEGRPVAYSMLRGFDEGYLVPSFGCCTLADLRDAGLGGALLMHAVEESRRLGASTLRLTVSRANLRAVALYRRCGFQLRAKGEEEWVGLLDLERVPRQTGPILDAAKLAAWSGTAR
jgi:ribosomal protein S18 acetylase RimI-like enzyme